MECECLLQNNWWSLGSPSDWVAGCCGARLRVVLGRWVPDRQFFCTHFSIRKSRFSNSSSQVSFGYTIRSQYPPHRGPRSGIKWHRVLRSASRCRTLGFSAKRLQAGTKLLFAFLLKSENMWQTSPHPLTSLPKLGFSLVLLCFLVLCGPNDDWWWVFESEPWHEEAMTDTQTALAIFDRSKERR